MEAYEKECGLKRALNFDAESENVDAPGYRGKWVAKMPVFWTPPPSQDKTAPLRTVFMNKDFTPPPVGIQTALRLQSNSDPVQGTVSSTNVVHGGLVLSQLRQGA